MNKTLFKRTDQIDHFLRELFQSNQISIIRRNVSSMTKELWNHLIQDDLVNSGRHIQVTRKHTLC